MLAVIADGRSPQETISAKRPQPATGVFSAVAKPFWSQQGESVNRPIHCRSPGTIRRVFQLLGGSSTEEDMKLVMGANDRHAEAEL